MNKAKARKLRDLLRRERKRYMKIEETIYRYEQKFTDDLNGSAKDKDLDTIDSLRDIGSAINDIMDALERGSRSVQESVYGLRT